MRQSQKALRNLDKPDLEIEAEMWEGVVMRTQALVGPLEKDVKVLDATLDEISAQRRRVQNASKEKNEAFGEFKTNYLHIGQSTEATYRMVGLDAEANRVRPSIRRLAATDIEDTGDGSDAEQPEEASDVATEPGVQEESREDETQETES